MSSEAAYLSTAMRELLGDSATPMLVSAATGWEIRRHLDEIPL